uniref:Putative splicing factor n=1 Tax=Rhodnius neglectus TaxID=72488 RepID=A0A0N7Z9M7_9HEMI
MSTLSGVSSKGEKGKSKFQSLDINSLYNKTSRGESSEPHTQKSTVPRKHGMQSLGKVPSARRPPANLPSLKSEHSGNDPTVSLVPTGGTGWGSKPGETGPSPTIQTPPQPTAASSINHSIGTSAPAAVGTPAPQTNTISQPPTQGQVNVKQTGGSSSSSGGDKTWSSVMSGGETGPSFLAHQSPQFQQEFPSLSGEAAAPVPLAKGPIGQEGQYGPGPSLRPQTEGSWIQGGGTRAPPPVTTTNTTTSPPQHPFLPPESVPGGNRNNLGQFGSATVPGGPPPQQPPQIPSQFKGVVPPFMLNRGGGFPNMFPPNFNSPPVRPRFHAPPENRFVQGSRPPPLADPEDLIPRPIIREEDLNRMDEISRDTGWATQDDIDYNQKLAFSDDEGAGPDDNSKDTAKDSTKSSSPSLAKDEKDLEMDKDPNEKQSDRLSAPSDKQQPPPQPWQGRGPPTMSPSDFRNQISRPSPHPASMLTTRVVDVIEEHWKEKRRQLSEKLAAVTEKAKQRKEEEEKRFEESCSKSHMEMEQKNKKGKEDVHHSIEQHSGGNANISEWEKETMPAQQQIRENKEAVENFRQMTQLDNRPNFNREKERDRDVRGERDVQTFQRFQSNLPPRFQKQMNDRPGNQQYMRQSPNNVANSLQSFDTRWSITNSHNTSHFSGKQTNNTGRRNETEITDRDIDRDRMKDNDDKDRRERLTPEDSIERERREREELEWEGRRGNSSWDHNRHYDDKYQGRRDAKKSSNDTYSNKPHDRDNEWRDRPQRPESRERPDRPPRPDSRDSRASRESRNSRESMREESRAIPELMNNDYPWADIEYEKEIREEKPRKKENYKDEKRDNLPRREGHVPGPITREKMEAYEHKQNLAKAEKKEVMGGQNNIANSGGDDDSRNKLQSSTSASVGGVASNTVSWADSTEDGGSTPSNQAKDTEQSAVQASRANDDMIGEKNISNKESLGEKKKENIVKDKDKSSRGGRGGRGGGNRASGNYPPGSNYGSVFYRGSGSSWNSKEPRRSSNKSGSQKQGQWNASESEASADEISASTESGKEDKKTERKQIPRSPRPGERKRDKDERIRDSKKNENDKNRQDKKQQGNVGQGSGYESGGGSRKEGFAPRGEPSRRGRGGYRATRGNLGNVAGHYGPPGNKSPFPSHGQHDNKQEDDSQIQSSGGQAQSVSDLDSSAGDDKTKQKQAHVQSPVTGIRQNKDNVSSRLGKNKSNSRKGGSGGEEWETTSEASDSESKNLKHSKIQQKMDKSKIQRPVGDKRGQFSTAHMNGRPSRSEDGKDNGFQEVRSKKIGKESRPLGKDEPKRGRGKEGKAKSLQGTNTTAKAVQSKSYTREWSNNKPPRLQRLENNRKQQHQQQQQEVSEMNKINQNVTALFPIRDAVTCSAGAPPPPPSVNAWDKPITATLRTTPPPANNPLHLASTLSNSQDKSAIDLNEHGQSGASSQTSSPSAEKALTKMGRDAVEKALLDGTTPPVQTIIFENTNYKVPSEMAMKAKYSSLKGQRIDKARGKLEEDLEGSSHGIGLGFKSVSEMKQGDNKPQEPIQISMSFSKNEDNADMKLDFAFDSDLSQLTEDKTNIPRSIHLGQTSAADLNQKIASVKKVWETAGAVMEHQHHVDENHGVVSTSSSFTPNFGSAVDTALDHSAAHQVDDSSFTNSDVYSAGPTIQPNSGAYSSGGTNIIKQDPNSGSTNVKPQPQQTTVMSSGIGTHSAPSLSSPPPAFTQQGHFNYQAQYSNMPAIPSPPAAVLINSATGAQQVNHQGELFHSFPLGGPTVIGNQAAARSGYSQYAFSLSQGLGQTSAAAFSQPSIYLPQPAAPPPPPNAPPDVFPSMNQFRMQPSAYGQSQQLSNNPSTVLITSSSNSLMSASVKSSPQPPIGAPIGTKGGYQSSAHPSQVPLGYIHYESQMLPQNFLQNSQLVQQRHGGSNVVPTIQPPTSYYSNSAGGQTGLFQPGTSILASTGSQPGLHNAATAFGIQGFGGTQSAGNPGGAPSSSNPVGVPSFTTQMGHFRAPAPANYLKAGNPSGQHPSDASKSPSNNQDVLSVFTTGGGQIPSPKSRATGGATGGGSGGGAGSASGGGGTAKQVGPSPASQQPSPTQSHHKFSSYQSQQNLVLQQQGSSPSGRGPQMAGGGVRNSVGNTAGGGGSASSGSLSANGVLRFPNPIQRPVDLHQYQQQQHQQQQQMMQQVAVAAAAASAVNQPRHNRLSSSRQQHIKLANQYYPPQGNPVKLDGPGLVEGKTDTDKLQENNTSASKQDKGKEEASTSNEQ